MSYALQQVSFSYEKATICDRLDWRLPAQGVVCLWGPSGCGKTTLLRLLAGLERPAGGTVLCPADSRVSMVFQEDRLLPWMTALENVMLPGAEEEQAAAMLTRLGLGEELHSRPAALSGGQQRRVALARALASPGDLLLLDEPFNGLDEATWRQVVPLITTVAVRQPVVLVTHVREQATALEATVLPLTGLPLTGQLEKSEKF